MFRLRLRLVRLLTLRSLLSTLMLRLPSLRGILNAYGMPAQANAYGSISQDDTHLVKFTGNVYYPTAYATKTQTTTVKLSAASQSYTKVVQVAGFVVR